jgi:hypothetical protein
MDGRDTTEGEITILRGNGALLSLSGEATYAMTPDNVRTGELEAEKLKPNASMLAFISGDEIPFDQAKEGDCAARIGCVGEFLVTEENGFCGGTGVSITGLYHR